MRCIHEDRDFISLECDWCKKVLKVDKGNCVFRPNTVHFVTPVKCPCNRVAEQAKFEGIRPQPVKEEPVDNRKPEKNHGIVTKIVAVAVLLLLAAGVAYCVKSWGNSMKDLDRQTDAYRIAKGGDCSAAWTAAKKMVTGALKSPGTADFGSYAEQNPQVCVTDLHNGEYAVRGFVNADNSLRVKMRRTSP